MALTFDGYTLRLRPFWLPSYASLDCLPPPCHSFFLSYVSCLLSSSSLSTLSPVSSLFLFFLSFSSFSFPLTSPKVLHVRVYVRSLFFFPLVFLARSEALVNWLESNSQGSAAFGVTWSEMYGANRGVCYPFPRIQALFPEMLVKVDWGFGDSQSDLYLAVGSPPFASSTGSVSVTETDEISCEPRLTLTNVPRNGPPNTLDTHWTSLLFFSICVRFPVWASFFFFPFLSFPAYDSRSVGRSFSTQAPCTFASPLSLSFLLFVFFFNYCSVSIAVMID